jgi:hypothetical protein
MSGGARDIVQRRYTAWGQTERGGGVVVPRRSRKCVGDRKSGELHSGTEAGRQRNNAEKKCRKRWTHGELTELYSYNKEGLS